MFLNDYFKFMGNSAIPVDLVNGVIEFSQNFCHNDAGRDHHEYFLEYRTSDLSCENQRCQSVDRMQFRQLKSNRPRCVTSFGEMALCETVFGEFCGYP